MSSTENTEPKVEETKVDETKPTETTEVWIALIPRPAFSTRLSCPAQKPLLHPMWLVLSSA